MLKIFKNPILSILESEVNSFLVDKKYVDCKFSQTDKEFIIILIYNV